MVFVYVKVQLCLAQLPSGVSFRGPAGARQPGTPDPHRPSGSPARAETEV